MRRFFLFLIAAGFVLAGSGAAFADPISAAIVAAIGLSGAAATVATSVITLGLTLAGSALASSLFRQDTGATRSNSGVKQDVSIGGKTYHEGAFGQVATKGHYVYWNTSGTNNSRLDQVYALSTGWCYQLNGLKVQGETVTLTVVDSGTGWTKYAVTLPDDGGTRRLWVTFWDGRPDQAANPTLIATANPPGRWSADHIGAGICYAHVEADYDANIDSFRSVLSGQAFLFVFQGLRLYDWRLDSTAGGSGSHRWDDQSTWEWSDNPAVCKYNYERGIFINGAPAIGMGVPSYDLLTDLYTAAANVCDESVALDGGGSEARYRVSLIASDGAEHIDAIDSMVTAMAGRRVERQGQFGVIAGAAQVPVATITDDDLIAEAPVNFTAKKRREELVNEVHGQFTDPDNLWDGSDIVPVIGGASVKAEDGGEDRPVTKNLYQVISPTQGQRLFRIAFEQGRQQGSAQITLGEEAIAYEVGDWLIWNSAKYQNRTWLIVGHAHDVEQDRVTLTLEETASGVFSWTTGDENAVALPATPPGANSRPTNVSSLLLQATSIAGTDGQELPAIAVSWDAVTDETVTSVIVDYKRAGAADTTAQRAISNRPATGVWTGIVLSAGILAVTDYEVRTTITTFPSRRVTWSNWETITTSANYRVPSAVSVWDGKSADIPGDQLLADLASATELAREARDSLLDVVSGTTGVSDITEMIEKVAEGILAQAARTQSISAQSTGAAAAVQRLDKVVADGNTALAEAIQAVATRVGANEASVTEISRSVDGISAEYIVAVEAGGVVGGQVIKGIKKADGTGEISFGIAANVFYIVDPDNPETAFSPFFIEGGVVYISEAVIKQIDAGKISATTLASISANLGTITAGKLQSEDGNFLIDLTNKRIVIQ